MAERLPVHPRALIRHAVVRVLKEHPATVLLMGGRVCPNRMEHWLADELPACGVYTMSEEVLESDISPDPNERRIALVVELLSRMTEAVDDTLDALTLAVEKALMLPAIGAAMTAIVNERLAAEGKEPLPPVTVNGGWRSSILDTLLTLKLTTTELGIAVDGNREIGVAGMNFTLEYACPEYSEPLPDFLLAVSGWDALPHDNVIDMVSRVEFTPKE